LKLMPFKSLGVVSYSHSIVTMTVSAAILQIFNVKVCGVIKQIKVKVQIFV